MPEPLVFHSQQYGSVDTASLSSRSILRSSNPKGPVGESVPFSTTRSRTLASRRTKRGHASLTVSVKDVGLLLPPVFYTSTNSVLELLELPPGWNSHSAKEIALPNVVATIKLLAVLLDPGTPPPIVVPRVKGNIQLEWHTEEIDLEVYIDSPSKIYFFAEDVTDGSNVERPLAGHVLELKQWLKRVCSD